MRKGLIFICIVFSTLSWAQTYTYDIEEIELIATIRAIKGINQRSDDFSPVISGDDIYFTSSRQYNKHNLGENNWDKNGYLNVFKGRIKYNDKGTASIRDIHLLSNKLNAGTHTGPISFSGSGDTLFFTRVVQVSEGGKKFYTSKLYAAIKKKNTWVKIKQLPFCKDSYSYGHPSFDHQQNRLYFASNLPGGKGKNDIYYTEIKNGSWSSPVNVATINTAENEQFPFVVGQNIFFSSDRENGQGQMDVYLGSVDSENETSMKLSGLNSSFDDFGISVLPDLSMGYFSSNRNGNDDIFYFTLEKKVTVRSNLSGSFTFRSIPANVEGLKVQLFSDDGEFVYEEKTDKTGKFLFKNIEPNKNYNIRLIDENNEELVIEFFDKEGKSLASFILNEKGEFKYKKLSYQNNNVISLIPEDMIDFEAKTAKLSGKLVSEKDPRLLFKDKVINLIDANNDIVLTTKTDSLGNFEFKDLDILGDYRIQIENCSEELLMYIYGLDDNIHAQLKCNPKDQFMYRRLKPELGNSLSLIENSDEEIFMINTSEIIGRFEATEGVITDNKPCKVNVFNNDGKLMASTQTDSSGNFRFNTLSSEKTYKFTADCDNQKLLTLYNRDGKQVAKLQKEEFSYYIFRPLGFETEYALDLMDDNIKFDLEQSEKYDVVTVYFNTNESGVLYKDLEKINTLRNLLKKHPKLKLSISAYADATASEEYNFMLSQKRGDWIANYLVKKGIEQGRVTVNAYGETKLIDPENDAINRRAELRIYQ